MKEKPYLKQFLVDELDMEHFKIIEAKPKRIRFHENHISVRSYSKCNVFLEDDPVPTEQIFDEDARYPRETIPWISMFFDNNDDHYMVSISHTAISFKDRKDATAFYNYLDWWYMTYPYEADDVTGNKKDGADDKQ